MRADCLAVLPALASLGILTARAEEEGSTDATRVVLERMRQVRETLAAWANVAAVSNVRYPRTPVGTHEKFEVSFDIVATYANPFDPEQVNVAGTFRLPDGGEVTVPAFFMVPYRPENGVTQMEAYARYKPEGAAGWRLRFAAEKPGRYSFRLRLVDSLGRHAEAGPFTFSVVQSDRPGFVRVARGNPRYLENSADGSLFFGTGCNVAWTRWQDPGEPVACYEYYLRKAAGQMTSTRVFLCHWAWLEWTPRVGDQPDSAWTVYGDAGWYNQMIATSVDRILSMAEKQRLRVMLTTDTGDEWFPTPDAWGSHPYSVASGGPCASPAEMFTSGEARRLYRNRLRYIIARWGYSDSLWALNAWNNCQAPSPAELDWLREMRDHVHGLCRGWRPLLYGTNYRFAANEISDYAQPERPLAEDRPTVLQECYYANDPAWFRPVLRQQLWEGLTGGLASVMVWPHPVVDKTNAWQDFRPVVEAAARLPLNRGKWHPAAIEVTGARGAPPAALRLVEARAYGDVPDWGIKAPQNRFRLDLTQSALWLEGFGSTLYGDRPGRVNWRNPPKLLVDLPTRGRLLVEVTEIGAGDQKLCITVDGAPAASHTFRAGRRELSEDEMWTSVPLSAGRHEIRLDNVQPGGDWLRPGRLLVVLSDSGTRALLTVQGLTDGRRAVVYLRNRSHDRLYGMAGGGEVVNLTEVTLRLAGLKPGRCQTQWLDPATGAWSAPETVACRNSALTVALSRLEAEAVLLLTR